jgi:hypothetical protein
VIFGMSSPFERVEPQTVEPAETHRRRARHGGRSERGCLSDPIYRTLRQEPLTRIRRAKMIPAFEGDHLTGEGGG